MELELSWVNILVAGIEIGTESQKLGQNLNWTGIDFSWNCTSFVLFVHTLSLKRNAPWIHWLPLWPRLKVKWPRQDHIWYREFETGREKPHSKMSNGSPDILKSPRVYCVLEFVKLLKSRCHQWKFGIFSKRCISFGQECMVLNPLVYFNSAVLKVMF